MPTDTSVTNTANPAPASKVIMLDDENKQNNAVKILVVEDEPDARTIFVDFLGLEGYEVSSAVDGIDAIAKAEADKYDLILLDIVMPNKDGLDVLEEIKSDAVKFGNPIVIMLTNISGDAAVEKAKELGAKDFLLKIGTEPDMLVASVKKFLAEGKAEAAKPAAEPEQPAALPVAA